MPDTTRVAAIDCGTNSIRLLIADVFPDRSLVDVVRTMKIVRLGEDVDRTGVIKEEAMQRTFDAIDEYAHEIRKHDAQSIRFVATSATRDATNGAEFVEGVEQRLGIKPQVADGETEARLSFEGALSGLKGEHASPLLTVDIGGGSTEFAFGTVEPEAIYSMNIGCVRMTERYINADPPTPEQVSSAIEEIDAQLHTAAEHIPFDRTAELVGLAGSVTTVTAHALRLESYDPSRINGAALPPEDVLGACGELLHMTRAERRALPYMAPGRVDVIGAGALIWSRIVAMVLAESRVGGHRLRTVKTSEHDILDGIALWAAAVKQQPGVGDRA